MGLYTRPEKIATSSTHTQDSTAPLIVITALFFMWGLLTSLNDVLIPHLKEVYTLSYSQVMLVQLCFFGAYLLASLPAGMLIKRIGYQRGVVVGLTIAALGCAIFYPAASGGYSLFLLALFTLACGITVLQVAANPYVTALGNPRTASSRLTLTQAFNALGTTMAPAIGGILILGAHVAEPAAIAAMSAGEQAAYRAHQAAAVQGPYLVLAGTLLVVAVVFALIRLPKLKQTNDLPLKATEEVVPLRKQAHLVLGVLGIFAYVGAEVSIGSFLINFLGEPHIGALAAAQAAHYVSYYWGGAMVGRFVGFMVMRSVSPGKALAFNACGTVLLVAIAMFSQGAPAMVAIIAVGLFNSIMFPTIFSMALHGLGSRTGQASGLLCMAIAGGAVVPYAQGFLADSIGVQHSFLVPALCYVFVLFYGIRFARMYQPKI